MDRQHINCLIVVVLLWFWNPNIYMLFSGCSDRARCKTFDGIVHPYTLFWRTYFHVVVCPKKNKNNKKDFQSKTLGSTINYQQANWGWPHVFLLHHSNISIIILLFNSLINISFFINSTSVILGLPLPLFIHSAWIKSLFQNGALISFLCTWTNHLKQRHPYLKQFSSFLSCLFLYFHLYILTFSF